MKVVLVVALAMWVVALAWGGGILYWHLKLSAAIRTLQREAILMPLRNEDREDDISRFTTLGDLRESGCRALPHLVGSLDPSLTNYALSLTQWQIFWNVEELPSMAGPAKPSWSAFRRQVRINLQGPPETVKAKCLMTKEWWRLEGHKHHQAWRFWSSGCGPATPWAQGH